MSSVLRLHAEVHLSPTADGDNRKAQKKVAEGR